jgi:hypothetical protein
VKNSPQNNNNTNSPLHNSPQVESPIFEKVVPIKQIKIDSGLKIVQLRVYDFYPHGGDRILGLRAGQSYTIKGIKQITDRGMTP